MTIYRANNKRGYLNARILSSDTQLVLQDIDYGGGTKDRNIPTIVDETMRLVIWGIQYPSPSADLDREIISATWTGSNRVFNIVRAQEGTEAKEHYIGDNVALLFTADMSCEILIFEGFEESAAGSIAYTDDADEDGEMEVLALPPDNEVSTIIIPASVEVEDSYTENIDSQKFVYWRESDIWFTQIFTPTVEYNISGVILKLYRVLEPLICGGTVDLGYGQFCGWRIDDDGDVHQDLVSGYGISSYASAVCTDGKFYITQQDALWKFNKDGTVDTSWQNNGKHAFLFGTAILDLALDADENLYVVNSRPGIATSGNTIWKLDSDGNVIWSTYPLSYARSATSIVVGNDGYVYVAAGKPTGSAKRGMKLNPANGVMLEDYGAYYATHVAIDDSGFVYLGGGQTLYRFANDDSVYWTKVMDNWGSMQDIFVQSGGFAEDTKVFMSGQHQTTTKSVWKFDYNFANEEATYGGYYSYCISEDIDGNLLVGCSPATPGEDGEYQIIKLNSDDLSFIFGIKFNEAGIKHVSRQGFNLPGVVTVSIRATDISTGKPVGSDVCLGIVDGNNITIDSDGEEVVFTFSDYTLVPGIKYAIILKSPSGEFAHIGWKIDESNATYAGGATFISSDAGSTWSLNPVAGDGDFYFKTLSGVPGGEVEEGHRKILVSGGVGELPYWQFVWADEVGGARAV